MEIFLIMMKHNINALEYYCCVSYNRTHDTKDVWGVVKILIER